MKKTLLLLFVCAFSGHIIAQKTTVTEAETITQPSLPADDVVPHPPPPPPPAPPVPPPPPPPPPAPPQKAGKVKFTQPVIVNEKGYELSVVYNKSNNTVYAKKKGVTIKMSLDKWNADPAFYENKYGKLLLPPPPPVPLIAEQ